MKKPAYIKRSKARRIACQALYSMSFTPAADEEDLKNSLDFAASGHNEEAAVNEFSWQLAAGARARVSELDAVIDNLSGGRRIGKMERALLRLALYEMLHCDTPPRVIISETLEMADQFGSGHAKDFLNGVLHAAYKNGKNASASERIAGGAQGA